ncbi:MAG: RNA polymerase sigma factor [Ktedonobacteraceae bacterium]|nr:RNA polymerase sigma factor [Ktedonobacteraceae bacterium]
MHSLQQQEYIQPPEAEVSDGHLVKQARTGDQGAFETLVDRYHNPLFRYSRNILQDTDQTDDVLQFVFLQLYLCLPTLATEGSLKPWLFRVARNRCFDTLRKHRRKSALYLSTLAMDETEEDISPLDGIVDPNPLPEEVAVMFEIQASLQRALFTLPSSLRAIVHLHSFKHLSFTEIARILDIPQPTVKTYFYRSLPRLRTALMKDAYFTDNFPGSAFINW